jgi:hypothetical protein
MELREAVCPRNPAASSESCPIPIDRQLAWGQLREYHPTKVAPGLCEDDDEEVLILGFVLFVGSALVIPSLYAWARWDENETGRVRYVPPRYLLACAIGAVVGAVLIGLSQ